MFDPKKCLKLRAKLKDYDTNIRKYLLTFDLTVNTSNMFDPSNIL